MVSVDGWVEGCGEGVICPNEKNPVIKKKMRNRYFVARNMGRIRFFLSSDSLNVLMILIL